MASSLELITYAQQVAGTPQLSVYRTGALTLVAATPTAVSWDAENYQDNVPAGAMHSTVTNPTRMIAPIPGKYSIMTAVHVASNASAPSLIAILRVNGSTVRTQAAAGTAGAISAVGSSTALKLTASDYVEVLIQSSLAQAVTTGTNTTWATMSFLSS